MTACLWGSCLIAPPALAQESIQDTASARAIGKRAFAAFQEGDHETAIELFQKAEDLHHATTHLLFMARSHMKLEHPVEAFELYNRILREKLESSAPRAFLDAQESAREEVGAAEAAIAHVIIEVDGPGADEARLFVGERELSSALIGVPAPVNPGPQVFRAETNGARSGEVEQTMKSGEEVTVRLTLKPTKGGAAPAVNTSKDSGPMDDGGGSKVPAYLALGVGGVGVALGTVFTIQHFSKKGKADELFDERGCNSGCTTGDRADVEDIDGEAATAGTVGLIGYGVGAVGLGAGLALLLLGPPQASIDSGATIHPYFGWGQAGLHGKF